MPSEAASDRLSSTLVVLCLHSASAVCTLPGAGLGGLICTPLFHISIINLWLQTQRDVVGSWNNRKLVWNPNRGLFTF